MRLMKSCRLLLAVLSIAMAALAGAQETYVRWKVTLDPPDARAGESARVLMTAEILEGWHIYGLRKVEGPIQSTFKLEPGSVLESLGEAIAPAPISKFDENFGVQVELFEKQPVFALPVKLTSPAAGQQRAAVTIGWQACTEGTCDLPKSETFEFDFEVAPGTARAERTAALTGVPDQPEQAQPEAARTFPSVARTATDDFGTEVTKAKDSGLVAYLWLSFVAGLLALLTPCVFPMIPITVSFFSKSTGGEKKTNYGGAVAYCVGIVGTFTALGLGVTLLFGASGIQQLATNPWVNVVLALVFVALALSLFGMYELAVPAGVLTKLGGGSRAGGLVGPMLMGLTFSLTSFTCTVPFVGTLLAGAAAGGDLLWPTLGMLAFSASFALPFFFLALFPGLLANLPKSGSWLSTVKAVMGFVEIAAAVKFVSNVDLVWQLGWITQPVFLALWTSIAVIAACYLVGWVRLGNETEAPRIGWPRRGFGAAAFVASAYCLAGIQGAPLGEFAAFLPPDPYPGRTGAAVPGQVAWKHDYAEALAAARAENKPIFINFTGVTCTNCRWMEKNMFPRPDVSGVLSRFVPLELYTDRATPQDLANRELQRKLTKVVTLPVYVVLSPDEKVLKVFQGSTRDSEAFVMFLKQGSEAHGRLAQR